MTRFLLCAIAMLATATLAEAREANHLRGATSPYLLQHLDNPVDWYQWGPEALEKARAEGKLIFVSVGYSSCHWCHVMEDESFEDEAIAALLNEGFVSIKIDRESRPDLDEQFMFVTQALTGAGGWPNSVFLTPDGDPFFAGGYFPPEAFTSVVNQVQQAWREDRDIIAVEAAKVTRAATRYLTRQAAAREITPAAVQIAADQLLRELDPFNGGYGVAPKFPRESLFLFLLDQAERTGDRQLLRAVTGMLDGMIKGGIHDHVGGGFHRYALDPEWRVPHFEKMLYTQAMMGRLLVRAWGVIGENRYRRAAERLIDYVLRELRDPGGGFFAAQDADSLNGAGEKAEGAYYTWTETDLAQLDDGSGLISDLFKITPGGDLDGANVLALRGLPADLAAVTGREPLEFAAGLDVLLQSMQEMRRARPAPFLDRKIVVSWNAAMIQTLAEAAHLLDRPDYYQAAEQAARFILDEMQARDGLTRISFEGSAEIPAQLSDYASLALALVALHDHAPNRDRADDWLGAAQGLAGQIQTRFGAADTGYRMAQSSDGLSAIIPLDDGDLPSGNALALSLFAGLSHRAHVPEIEQDGVRLAAALSGHAIGLPGQRGFTLKAIQDLHMGETGPLRHAAKGAVRAEVHFDRRSGEIVLAITLADGWHINAQKPLEDFLVATDLAITGQPDLVVEYPDPVVKSLAFNAASLALFEGSLLVRARATPAQDGATAAQAKLTFQACSDEVCLQPEALVFTLW